MSIYISTSAIDFVAWHRLQLNCTRSNMFRIQGSRETISRLVE